MLLNSDSEDEYFYDTFYNIEKILFNNNGRVDYSYDCFERLNEKIINNAYRINYNYRSYGRKTSTLVDRIILLDNTVQYKYDGLNNITHVYLNKDLINQYYYDDTNQLIKEENHKTNELIEYSYDNIGNILSKKYFSLTSNALIKEDKYEYNNSNWADQLTKFNNDAITYDEIGNPSTIGLGITMEWINGKKLKNYIDISKGINLNYKYNEDDIRYEKVVNDIKTQYYLEGTRIIFEKRDEDVIQYLYDAEGVAGLEYNNNLYYFIKNVHGDIICIIDSLGTAVANYKYDSLGKPISIKDQFGNELTNPTHIGLVNPFRYRGYYWDSETQMYYLNSRYYKPEVGRYINADVILGANEDIFSYILYAYTSNNPINFSDPSGSWKLVSVKRVNNTNYYDLIIESDRVVNGNKTSWTSYTFRVYVRKDALGVTLDFTLKNNSMYYAVYNMGLSKYVAQGIWDAYKHQNKKSMAGRTITGIAYELDYHYWAYKKFPKWSWFHKSGKEADIETKDNNTRGWEFFEKVGKTKANAKSLTQKSWIHQLNQINSNSRTMW